MHIFFNPSILFPLGDDEGEVSIPYFLYIP